MIGAEREERPYRHTNPYLRGVRIPPDIMDAVVAHARFTLPEEACGLLAVDAAGALRMAYCLTNVARSAAAFTVDPDEHFAALRHAESRGWTIGGVFHSHPRGRAVPSRTDVAGALESGWLHLIVGLGPPEPEIRAWRIVAGRAFEVAVAGEARVA